MNRFIEYQANPHIMDLIKNYEIMQYSGQGSFVKLVKKKGTLANLGISSNVWKYFGQRIDQIHEL